MAAHIIGLIAPGAMGSTVGGALVRAGQSVLYCTEGRSSLTRQRAAAHGIVPVADLATMVNECETILSICPPAEALGVALQVASFSPRPLFVDANAVAAATAIKMADAIGPGFVDGCIVGPPVAGRGTTTIWIAGEHTSRVVDIFEGSDVAVRVIGNEIGTASILKLALSLITKVGIALALSAHELAERGGVGAEFRELSTRGHNSISELASIQKAIPKARRHIGEMQEIERVLRDMGLPTAFGEGAGEMYALLSDMDWSHSRPYLQSEVAGESSK